MVKVIKFDFHTHPIEALRGIKGIKGILDINKDVVKLIVDSIKHAGLGGIAITKHNNFNLGWVTSLLIREYHRSENLIILPGAEVDYRGQQFLKIYIPDFIRRMIPFFRGREWFVILAHPGYYNPLDMELINRVQFDAVEITSLHGNFSQAEKISRLKEIPLVRVSDAHTLDNIGYAYSVLEINMKTGTGLHKGKH